MKTMQLNAFAKLWYCDAGYAIVGKTRIEIYEPLDIDLPKEAAPYCYLMDLIDFYSDSTYKHKLKTIRHSSLWSAVDTLVLIKRTWYQITHNECKYVDNRWCMVWTAQRNTRLADMMNIGFPAYLGENRDQAD